jgi:ubiquinone/menaquinone biosynthesis C-methylase UbiE
MTQPNPLPSKSNIDESTVAGFGREWAAYDQTSLSAEEHHRLFNAYFSIFPFDRLPADAEGFDLGCGSGRWAELVLDRVAILHCIDPSAEALAVARRRLGQRQGARLHLASVDQLPLPDGSQDFGYSLGVLHHVPDTRSALRDCVRKLKPGAPFLLYLYYDFDNRPGWYRSLWWVSNLGRRAISSLPFPPRKAATSLVAATIYWPLARAARALERRGIEVTNLPLSSYRNSSFYTMKTDALDRFGTRLEQRFSRNDIAEMMGEAGLVDIRFSDEVPYWTAVGWKAS